jgi:hypothetical protein
MHRTLGLLSSLAALAGAVGCASSSGSGSGPAPACQPADVSFASDVVPIFQANCTSTSACHGQMQDPTVENLYLGPSTGKTDPAAVYAAIVNVKAVENPSMDLVAQGSTADSFLWHKLQSQADLQALTSECAKSTATCTDCAGSPCGGVMPYLADAFSLTNPGPTCTIQNWIANGAKNN